MSLAYINNVALAGSRQYEWALQSGAAPSSRTFELTEEALRRIGDPETVTLKIGDKSFERLYMLDKGPGRTPYHRTVTLSDVRWRWPDRPIASTFNERRVTGDTFLLAGGRVETQAVDNELRYAKFSLYPPALQEPWTPYQVLEWCLYRMPGVANVRALGNVAQIAVEINDLTIFDQGDVAIERVLNHMPGAAFYLAADGQTVVVYDTNDDRAELGIVRTLDARTHTRTRTTVKVSDKSRRRARHCDVYFVPEIEHLFTYNDAGTRTEDSNTLTMVAATPDPETVVNGRTVGRSTWVELSQLLASDTWAPPAGADRLTLNSLREQYGGQWRYLEPLYAGLLGATSAQWAGRWRTIRQSYRRLFQVDAIYRQRLAAVKAHRVAILNYETGTRGPAEAYCDWVRRPTFLGLGPAAGADPDQGWVVQGYSDTLDDAEPAPVAVRIADPGAMVFSLDPVVDPYGLADAIMLGRPEGDEIPKQDIGRANQGAEVLGRWDFVKMQEFQMSLLVTVIPGSPNTLERLFKVTVPGPVGAKGPPVAMLAFPGLITAQVGWRDDRGQQILDYVRGIGNASISEDWLVNRRHVQDVASAMAAAYYDRVKDTPAGSVEIDLDGSLVPTGQLASVTHRMDAGRLVSLLSWPGARRTIDAWRYLNASTRRALLGVLEAGNVSGVS